MDRKTSISFTSHELLNLENVHQSQMYSYMGDKKGCKQDVKMLNKLRQALRRLGHERIPAKDFLDYGNCSTCNNPLSAPKKCQNGCEFV